MKRQTRANEEADGADGVDGGTWGKTGWIRRTKANGAEEGLDGGRQGSREGG